MKKILVFFCAVVLVFGIIGSAGAIVYTYTAGDKDFGADRDSYDVATNMDFYVFGADVRMLPHMRGPATNNKGWIETK